MDSAKTYWIYILTNEPRGVLYVGMTSDLPDERSSIASSCWMASPSDIGSIGSCIMKNTPKLESPLDANVP